MPTELQKRFAPLCLTLILAASGMPAARADALTVVSHAPHESAPETSTSTKVHLDVDAPLPGPLSHGAVVVPFHADHLQIAPVYGATAAQVVPRLGHLHLTLDNAGWHWVHASSDLIVIQGLISGKHTLQVDLADANHAVLDSRLIVFTVPEH